MELTVNRAMNQGKRRKQQMRWKRLGAQDVLHARRSYARAIWAATGIDA